MSKTIFLVNLITASYIVNLSVTLTFKHNKQNIRTCKNHFKKYIIVFCFFFLKSNWGEILLKWVKEERKRFLKIHNLLHNFQFHGEYAVKWETPYVLHSIWFLLMKHCCVFTHKIFCIFGQHIFIDGSLLKTQRIYFDICYPIWPFSFYRSVKWIVREQFRHIYTYYKKSE